MDLSSKSSKKLLLCAFSFSPVTCTPPSFLTGSDKFGFPAVWYPSIGLTQSGADDNKKTGDVLEVTILLHFSDNRRWRRHIPITDNRFTSGVYIF
ncbi:hypothetical protein HanRHA438_Chr11g0487481 [Helianthus annuus]|nr:hypothetical protein HanRHA438_Chr11g0487481 [Helianthus annuus]